MKNRFFVLLAALALLLPVSCEPEIDCRKPPKPIEEVNGRSSEKTETEKKEPEKPEEPKEPETPQTPEYTEDLKLMSFNIRYAATSDTGDKSWRRRKSAVCEMVNTEKPAVMGTQECLSNQKADILDGCKDYAAIGVGRDDGRNNGEMMAIFYRKDDVTIEAWGTFWLSLTPDVPSKDWDSACKRCATWARIKINASGKKFFYVDTHLDHKNGQAEQMAVLEEKMDELNIGHLPMFLSADFNVVEDDALFNHVQGYMCNARKTAPETDHVKSYNSWGKAGSGSIIDIIFYSRDKIVPLKFHTVTEKYDGLDYISDHYPIYGIFAIPAAAN